MSLSLRDKKLIWHPFTQERTAALPIAITRAKGSYVYDENNKEYLDLISSWWVNLHGHAHPEIARRIYDQALTLEHIIFAGFTHEPAVQLCEGLKSILPPSLSRFFFSDNGSTAVEVALKMAYQYWQNQGETKRKLFLCFDGAYHGDTFGCMSVGVKSGYHNAFKEILFDVLSIPFPETWDEDIDVDAKENAALIELDRHLSENGEHIAAIILEPLVQGASGMRMCRPSFVTSVLNRLKAYGILVIFDEVMTGFGRTGTKFALEQIDITPDFLCLSKGISGGFLPLAMTVTTDKIFNAFLHDEWRYAFAHGHSYTANPIACAAGIASLNLLTKPETATAMLAIQQSHENGIQNLKRIGDHLHRFRIRGTISAFDVKGITTLQKQAFLDQGLLLRPLGETVYLFPPYCTTQDELEMSYEKITTILSRA